MARAREKKNTSAGNFYITTPIYYANDKPHIGHAYTTLLADVISRFHRLLGYEVFFLTGTDEHGQKVEQAARRRGVTPQEHVDEYHTPFKEMWAKLNIQYDHFIRTTDATHKQYVQKQLQNLYDKGEIVLREYAGWYSVSEERFFTEDELVDGKDPVSGRRVEWISEKNYFFLMSKYQQRLVNYIEKHPDFIVPDYRRNEVLGFLRQPLQDLCISRPVARLSWGIPLPFDSDFVTYVWFDALLNYQSAVAGACFSNGASVWPANYHLIGKDILTTHCVYWPTMLLALEQQLPRHILAHGWWLNKGAKQSKTSGNAIDPLGYVDQYGADAVRYFLMRDMVLGQDASFSDEMFIERINTDLANDLGNAIQRVHVFICKELDGRIPGPGMQGLEEKELEDILAANLEKIPVLIKEIKLSFALEAVSEIVRAVNRYLERRAPWQVVKDPERRAELETILYAAGDALRCALILLSPVIPEKARQGLMMLGQDGAIELAQLRAGLLESGKKIERQLPLFPRIEDRDGSGKSPAAPVPDCSLLDLRVGRIVSINDHPEADKLYVLQVDLGQDQRQIVAGLKNAYSESQLKDRLCVVLTNLKPAKLRGQQSQGMLLAASLPSGPALLVVPEGARPGELLHFKGAGRKPPQKINLDDLKAARLLVKNQAVFSNEHTLECAGKQLVCQAPDNTEVR